MKRFILVAAPLALVLVLAAIIRAEDAPTTAPAATPPAATPTVKKSVKLDKPWKDVTNLSDDQKEKIHDIHAKFLKDRHELEVKERSDIMALLSDDQKQQVEDLIAKMKAGASNHKPKADAATQPTTQKSL